MSELELMCPGACLSLAKEVACPPDDWLQKHNGFILTILGILGGGLGAVMAYCIRSRCSEINCCGVRMKREVMNATEVANVLPSDHVSPPPSPPTDPTPLQDACLEGDVQRVTDCLSDPKVDINERAGPQKYTALHTACSSGHAEVVRLLIDRGANVHLKDQWGCTPLCCLFNRESTVRIVRMLLKAGADHRIGDRYAVKEVSDIITAEASAEPDKIDDFYRQQCGYEAGEATKELLRSSTLDNSLRETASKRRYIAEDDHHRPGIHPTASEAEVLEYLLSALSPSDRVHAERKGCRALHIAVLLGWEKEVQHLLNTNVELDARDEAGDTALMLAASMDRPVIIWMLLDKGASRDIQDDAGWTALMHASYGGQIACVRSLLYQGASPDIQNKQGVDALEMAILNKEWEVARVLLAYKAKKRQAT